MNSPRGRIGRPPGPHDHTLAKLLPAALRLLVDEGGAALTPTRLHAETGVARATIYRNWPGPADLIEVMLVRATERAPDGTFSGELAPDLHQAAELVRSRIESDPVRPFLAACLDYGHTSERVAAAAQDFIAGLLEPLEQVLAAAVDGGELNGDVDDLVSEVAGPLILEQVILSRTVSPERLSTMIDHFLAHHVGPPDPPRSG